MFKILFIIILSICFYDLKGQDNIILKNGDEIQAKVLEVAPDVVKYKKWDNQEGPVYTSAKAEIFMIKYANGSKDVFTEAEPSKPVDQSAAVIGVAKAHMEKQIAAESKGAIKLLSFDKQNGVVQEIFGQKMYTLEYSLVIQILKPIWKASADRFLQKDWFWNSFHVRDQEGDIYSSTFMENYRRYEQGTMVRITGEMQFEATDNGWRLGGENMFSNGYDNKSSLDLSTPVATEGNTKPAPPHPDQDILIDANPAGLTHSDIIEKYFEAIGGKDKVAAVKSIDKTYLLTFSGIDIKLRQIQYDGKFYMDMTSPGIDIMKQVFNGNELRAEQMGKTVKASPEDITSAKMSAIIFPELLIADPSFQLKLLGTVKLNNTNAYKLEYTLPTGTIVHAFYDTTTFLKLKETSISGSGKKKSETTAEFGDYKMIDGVSIPHTMDVSGSVQEKMMMKLKEVKLNVTIDETMFKI